MKYLKKYCFGAVLLLLFWLTNTYLSERRAKDLWLLLFLAIVAYSVIRMVRSRKKYRYCPKCGCGTELGWHTEKIDARKKWVRVGSKWHYGGFMTQKTAIIRCRGCGWETNLGK